MLLARRRCSGSTSSTGCSLFFFSGVRRPRSSPPTTGSRNARSASASLAWWFSGVREWSPAWTVSPDSGRRRDRDSLRRRSRTGAGIRPRDEYFSANRAPGGTFGNRNFVAHMAAIGLPALVWGTVTARRPFGALLGSLGAPSRGGAGVVAIESGVARGRGVSDRAARADARVAEILARRQDRRTIRALALAAVIGGAGGDRVAEHAQLEQRVAVSRFCPRRGRLQEGQRTGSCRAIPELARHGGRESGVRSRSGNWPVDM